MTLEILGEYLSGTKISGSGKYIPDHFLTNDDLSRMMDTSDGWIKQRVGTERRPILNNPKWATAELGAAACRDALHDAGVKAKKVGALILATNSPDHPIPATAPRVAHLIGMESTAAFDVGAGCSGFLYGLDIGNSFIRSGRHDFVLVVGAEALSRKVNWSDRSTAVIFSDGAGAFLLERSRGPVMPWRFYLGSDGSKVGLLNIPAGGSRQPATKQDVEEHKDKIHMQGSELTSIAVTKMSQSIRNVLAESGIPYRKIQAILAHQANLRLIEMMVEGFGRKEKFNPEQVMVKIEEYDNHLVGYVPIIQPKEGQVQEAGPLWPYNIHRMGNPSAASIPILAAEAEKAGIIKANQIVVLVAFGAGLTWGAGIMKWREDSEEPTPLKRFHKIRDWLGTTAKRYFFSVPLLKSDSKEDAEIAA